MTINATDWELAHGRRLTLGARAVVMGILNVTPDSFSDGGRFLDASRATAHGLRMIEDGAGIVDVGGESSRPGADGITAAEEEDRVLPVVEALARQGAIVSIDTWRAGTARLALAAGAHIVNDIWGLQRDPDMPGVIAAARGGVVVMHNSRQRVVEPDVIADQRTFLRRSLALAQAAGIGAGQIVIDPGFGFGKERPETNIDLMRRVAELHELGHPILAGTSRKRFLGSITGREAAGRDAATAATSVILRLKGAAVFRVHDVRSNVDALAVADAVLAGTDAGER